MTGSPRSWRTEPRARLCRPGTTSQFSPACFRRYEYPRAYEPASAECSKQYGSSS
jgi:hypothetical protein